jgi:hypothetical protein
MYKTLNLSSLGCVSSDDHTGDTRGVEYTWESDSVSESITTL